ncbi:hypothetical protein [Thiolapillus brandeum]|uniref:Uncharacterized protein n=1 Tax=Thiolapillus brandeum TaxID=1076588 RepID=A0A7U6JHP2_9GAMM|nr:hypothetical protein [Thiolapillus brandeum]BAO43898.1 hypothetical protein TBH_C0968 [Thiolapillus brandeum]
MSSTYISFHDAERIEADKPVFLHPDCWTTRITAYDEKGESIELTLFSKEPLEIEQEPTVKQILEAINA